MTKTINLIRDLKVGECVSFDGGRLTVCLREKSGRSARLKFTVQETLVIDKPHPIGVERQGPEDRRSD